MYTAIVLFMLLTLLGVTLAVIGGGLLDIIESEFYEMGWFDVPPEWDTYAVYRGITNIFYAIPYILPLMGLFILLYTIYQRYTVDVELDDDDDDGYRPPRLHSGGMMPPPPPMEMYEPPEGRL